MSVVYWRQDFNPQCSTPKVVQDALLAAGGKNEYGEPLWRLILAANHVVQRSGEWRTARPGEDHVNFTKGKKDGSFDYTAQEIKPMRVQRGTRWVPLYPKNGWILERWFPAYCFGDPLSWAEAKSFDGTPMMGPYPVRGEYWLMKGPWDVMPSTGNIRTGIASYENSTRHMHGKIDMKLFEASMRNFMKMLDDEEEAQYLRILNQARQLREGTLKDVLTNPKLSAFRNQALNGRGFSGHF